MQILHKDELAQALADTDLTEAIAQGFIAYSEGRAQVPPPGELVFDDPDGEVHLKYGWIEDQPFYVVKIASGFYGNPSKGLPSGDGMMAVFSRETGTLSGLLIDHGWLTDLRTAVAGAVSARALAPSEIECIGILGGGVQARMQLEQLARVTDCRNVRVWCRRPEAATAYCSELAPLGFEVRAEPTASEVAAQCQLIVCTTPSRTPLLQAQDVLPGTHITAVGSDTPGKQELAAELLGRADLVVVDSLSQCRVRGELAPALEAGVVETESVVELGAVLSGAAQGRLNDEQTTIADLTGVAVQDIQIAAAALEACGSTAG